MFYLTGVSTLEAKTSGRSNLGLLCQPGNSTHLDAGRYALTGADNGFYGLGAKADPTPAKEAAALERWRTWLAASVAPIRDRVAFATIPDVLNWIEVDGKRIPVGDAEGTLARYQIHAGHARALGLCAALVLQDGLGLEDGHLVAGAERIPLTDVDAVFVGGSDGFKLGREAATICRAARLAGKWSHVGRVNSWRRIEIVKDYADSVDGTLLGFGPTANWPRLSGWLDRLDGSTPAPAGRTSKAIRILKATA